MAETIIAINTNVTTNEHFDRYGQSFRSTEPGVSYRSNFKLRWQLFTDSPDADMAGADPANWTPANLDGCGAIATCDNDFRHRVAGTLLAAIDSGTTANTVDVKTSAAATEIPAAGLIALYDANGSVTDLEYSAAEAITDGFRLTLAAPFAAESDYPAATAANISQEPLFQSMYLPAESNPASGLFVFDCYAYSKRLAALADTSTGKSIATQGLELLPFVTTDDGVLKELPAYLIDTFSLSINLAEVGTAIPEYTGDTSELLAALASLVVRGLDIQVHNTESSWHDYAAEDLEDPEYARSLTAYRIRLTGSTGDYSLPIPLIHGLNGADGDNAPQVQIQYSTDEENWQSDPDGCTFIRFSVDDGATWSDSRQFVGADGADGINAPPVEVQYSVDGSVSNWHDDYDSSDIYLRFSVDGGSTWGDSLRIKAHTVRYQYAETATGLFHDDFSAASDRYIRWSVDGGVTWSAASKFMGDDGQDGSSFKIDAVGPYTNRSQYDAQSAGFTFLVTSGEDNFGMLFIKNSDTSGDWSPGIEFTPEGLRIQYSQDNITWHTDSQDTDVYIRFSTDGGSTWGTGMKVQGESAYVYIAYAADSAGNEFNLTPSDDLDYWNWIHTDAPISVEELTLEKFTELGGGWKHFQGDDGISYDWLSGAEKPAAETGKDGDWFVDTSKGDVYKKLAGSWVFQLNIIGKTGAGVTLKGEWDSSATYEINDGVTFGGSMYIATAQNSGSEPSENSSVWVLYISKGDPGSPGDDGYTPARGVDYWTAADIAEIKSYVDEAILNGSW